MYGKLHLPTSPDLAAGAEAAPAILPYILAIVAILAITILLRRLVNIFPSVIGCALRWKESVNLEASVKLSRDRDIIAISMFIPFCLIAAKNRLYDPGDISEVGDSLYLAITIGVMLVYFLLRIFTQYLFRPQKMNIRTYRTGCKASYTFFILLTLLLLLANGLASFLHLDPAVAKSAMLWISAVTYTLFILRKTQIFNSSCAVFTSILYLCALEFIPTGILVVSALIF